MRIQDIRRLTPCVEDYAYFQTSGFSPKPEPVIDEVIRWMRFQNQGPALPGVGDKMRELRDQTRSCVAGSLNAEPDEIMLNENRTIGINVVASGIDWAAGDNVVLSDHEHPGDRIPWYQVGKRYGVELRFLHVSNHTEKMLEEFDTLLDERTRVVSISHVSRQTGLRYPARQLVEIAHREGVPVMLDGAQAYGAIPVDVRELGCDFYTCSGHKYIMAPQGTGAFFVCSDMLEWLKPSWIGAHSAEEMDQNGSFRLLDSARRFEFATRNVADQAGFKKALEMWDEIGWSKVYERIAAYTDYMKASLAKVPDLMLETPMSYEESSGIVSFRIPGLKSEPVSRSLMERERVLVCGIGHDAELVRVSTHVFNTEDDCDRLVSGLQRILRSGY
jgi:L-cysteine/cystine lyase